MQFALVPDDNNREEGIFEETAGAGDQGGRRVAAPIRCATRRRQSTPAVISFERRRRLMDDWTEYLSGTRGQVIPLRR